MRLTFLGGAGTVTGSKYLIETGPRTILVDCGLFQGYKQLRLRNWSPLPVNPKLIDAVVLTHAHIDHSGYLPLLVRNGFRGPIYCTEATRALCGILLPDSGHLQEADARFANKRGFSKHRPASPLYTQSEAEACLSQLKPAAYDVAIDVGDDLSFRFLPSGHILGAAIILLTDGRTSVAFTGDLGRPNSPTMRDPALVRRADYLVVESTYGDRRHDPCDPERLLSDTVNRTADRGGVVLIPSFAVGRSHSLLYYLARAKKAGGIGDVPAFLDSPMAVNAAQIYCEHMDEHRLSAAECRETCEVARYVRGAEESKALDAKREPMVLLAASGMIEGGRILHHVKAFAPDARNTLLFTGFQAGGTRGAAIVGGAKEVKIHGEYVPIRAEVARMDMLSAHADQDEIVAWLRNFERPPKRTFVTHGEPLASDALRRRIGEELGWPCSVPDHLGKADLV